jgi:hypothetical protein
MSASLSSLSLLLDEISQGKGQPLSRLARLVPPYRLGKPATLSCLVRWVVDGVRGPDGKRIHLEAVRISGRWCSTPEALSRFVAAQTPVVDSERTATLRSPIARQRAAEQTARKLKTLGI